MRFGRLIAFATGLALLGVAPLAGQESSGSRGLLHTIQQKLNLPSFGGSHSPKPSPAGVGSASAAPGSMPTRGAAPSSARVARPHTAANASGRSMGQVPTQGRAGASLGTTRVGTSGGATAGMSSNGAASGLSRSSAAPAPGQTHRSAGSSATTMGQSRLYQRLGAFQQSAFGGAARSASPSGSTVGPNTSSTAGQLSGGSAGAPITVSPSPYMGGPALASPSPAPATPASRSTESIGTPTPAGDRVGAPVRNPQPQEAASDPQPTMKRESGHSTGQLQSVPITGQWMSGAGGVALPREDDNSSPISRTPRSNDGDASARTPGGTTPQVIQSAPSDDSTDGPSGVFAGPSHAASPGRVSAPTAVPRNVLIARQSPALSVETVGPRSIAVGVESAYQVNVINSGSAAAEQVVVTIDLPPWADVMGADVTSGATNSSATANNTTEYLWKIAKVDAMASEQLVLRIVPRERRPIDLKVRWDFSQVASQAMIEVQQPQLEMTLDGPREVLWGETQVFRLHVKNTGNGDAKNVRLALAPMHDPDAPKSEHTIPVVPAGGEEVVEVALVAAHIGSIPIDVQAEADHGASAALSERITVLRAALNLQVEAPELRFVGNRAVYTIRLKNTGSASARTVELEAHLPSNGTYVSNVGGGRPDPVERTVSWTIDDLPAASERSFSVMCELTGEGVGRMAATATAAGDLSTAAEATIRVDAIADLTLDIVDPAGPIAVGDEAEYVVTIRNRGTKQASTVRAVAYFSEGIEPTKVDGAKYRVSPGQVVFEPIAAIGPGEQSRLVIRARADKPGNHAFRVDVTSAMGTRLGSEETTYFYMSGRDAAVAANGGAPADATPADADETLTPPVTAPVGRTTGSLPYYGVPALSH